MIELFNWFLAGAFLFLLVIKRKLSVLFDNLCKCGIVLSKADSTREKLWVFGHVVFKIVNTIFFLMVYAYFYLNVLKPLDIHRIVVSRALMLYAILAALEYLSSYFETELANRLREKEK